ncbi:MAG: tetratricopeptide repeat protein [Sedimentisphaerales bacterium]|nr:tetratricopeptide repeat protein [Sedimentisphaerales bacterium]
MSKLLEVFGRAITVNVADLIWEWLNCVKADSIKKSYEKDFDDILELLARMEIEEAGHKLQFYLFENPACTRGRMAAAAICLHKNLLPQAIEELNSVYMREPTNTLALYALGNCYERLGKEAESIEFYQDALKFKNYLTLPRQRLAAIYLKNGRMDKAIAEYEELRYESPEDVASLVMLGHLYLANVQYEKAIEVFDQAILIHPDNFHGDEHDDVELFMQMGEFDQAAERVRWMLEKDDQRADLHLKLADIMNMLGEDAEAMVHLENALRLEPNCLEARVKRGMCLMRSGQTAGAAKEFGKALEINDEIIDAYVGLATAQKLADKSRESYGTLSLAATLAPNSVLLFSHMAALRFRCTSHPNDNCDCDTASEDTPENIMKNVVEKYAQQLADQPDNADAHYKYGLLLLHGSNLPAAAQHFEYALEINPTHYRARAKRAICLDEIGKKSEAVKILTSAVSLGSESFALHYKTAILFADHGQFLKTAEQLQSSLDQSFTKTAAASNLSVVLQNLGLVDKASAAWDGLDAAADDESGD